LLSLYQLSIFVAVAEERSFSAAARKRHLTQPAVSQQVRALEHTLGLPLFHREGQRIDLTEAGAQLLPMAQDLIQMSGEVERAMETLREETGGRVLIGHGAACCQTILPRLLRHFRKVAAEIQLSVLASDNRAVIERLLSHELDVGFVDLRLENNGLDYTPLLQDELVAIVPARHAWTRRENVTLADLCAAPLILPGEDSGLRASLANSLNRNGVALSDLNVVMEVGGADGLGPAVEAGIGVSVVGRIALRQLPPRVRGVPIAATGLEHAVYWARLHNRLPNRAIHRFQEFLTSADTAEFILREVREG
jgi:DNA-binding transcriptional LysR family regulator